jgi:hypothetical protein
MKITKAEGKQREELADKCDEAQGALANAIADYNIALERVAAYVSRIMLSPCDFADDERTEIADALRTAAEAHSDAVTGYNDAMENAKAFVEEVASRLREVYDGRSEKWQEGDKGQSADAFIQTWESFSPDEESELDGNVADEFEKLPEPKGDEETDEDIDLGGWREAWETFETSDAEDPAEELADLLRDLPEESDE